MGLDWAEGGIYYERLKSNILCHLRYNVADGSEGLFKSIHYLNRVSSETYSKLGKMLPTQYFSTSYKVGTILFKVLYGCPKFQNSRWKTKIIIIIIARWADRRAYLFFALSSSLLLFSPKSFQFQKICIEKKKHTALGEWVMGVRDMNNIFFSFRENIPVNEDGLILTNQREKGHQE